MPQEYRIFGGPGTGKTTYLTKQISKALQKYEPREIYVVSFTKAAATEIAGRGCGIPDTNIGTIHAMCYRHSDRDGAPIVETKQDLIDEWNARYGSAWPVGKRSGFEAEYRPVLESGLGPLESYSRQRSLMEPGRSQFGIAWERFKQEVEAVDFTDLLMMAPDELPGCKVLFVDEAQDMSPLQWSVVRRWGEKAEWFLVAGDDDQILYEFIGARVDEFLQPLPDEQKVILGQSVRLPKVIHAFSDKWIRQLGTRRQEKNWAPANDGGKISRSEASGRLPHILVEQALERAERGLSVMILASCGFVLDPVVEELSAQSVLFHNPYRKAFLKWNPYGDGTALPEAIRSWSRLCRAWAAGDQLVPKQTDSWLPWLKLVPARGCLKYGGRKKLEAMGGSYLDLIDLIDNVITDETLHAVHTCNTDWLRDKVAGRYRSVNVSSLFKAFTKPGGTAPENFKTVVGTVHSVKGGEADCVFLLPDISRSIDRDMAERGEGARDALTRMWYVGMTRARQELVLCAPGGRFWTRMS